MSTFYTATSAKNGLTGAQIYKDESNFYIGERRYLKVEGKLSCIKVIDILRQTTDGKTLFHLDGTSGFSYKYTFLDIKPENLPGLTDSERDIITAFCEEHKDKLAVEPNSLALVKTFAREHNALYDKINSSSSEIKKLINYLNKESTEKPTVRYNASEVKLDKGFYKLMGATETVSLPTKYYTTDDAGEEYGYSIRKTLDKFTVFYKAKDVRIKKSDGSYVYYDEVSISKTGPDSYVVNGVADEFKNKIADFEIKKIANPDEIDETEINYEYSSLLDDVKDRFNGLPEQNVKLAQVRVKKDDGSYAYFKDVTITSTGVSDYKITSKDGVIPDELKSKIRDFEIVQADNPHKYVDSSKIIPPVFKKLENIDKFCAEIFSEEGMLQLYSGEKVNLDLLKVATENGLRYFRDVSIGYDDEREDDRELYFYDSQGNRIEIPVKIEEIERESKTYSGVGIKLENVKHNSQHNYNATLSGKSVKIFYKENLLRITAGTKTLKVDFENKLIRLSNSKNNFNKEFHFNENSKLTDNIKNGTLNFDAFGLNKDMKSYKDFLSSDKEDGLDFSYKTMKQNYTSYKFSNGTDITLFEPAPMPVTNSKKDMKDYVVQTGVKDNGEAECFDFSLSENNQGLIDKFVTEFEELKREIEKLEVSEFSEQNLEKINELNAKLNEKYSKIRHLISTTTNAEGIVEFKAKTLEDLVADYRNFVSQKDKFFPTFYFDENGEIHKISNDETIQLTACNDETNEQSSVFSNIIKKDTVKFNGKKCVIEMGTKGKNIRDTLASVSSACLQASFGLGILSAFIFPITLSAATLTATSAVAVHAWEVARVKIKQWKLNHYYTPERLKDRQNKKIEEICAKELKNARKEYVQAIKRAEGSTYNNEEIENLKKKATEEYDAKKAKIYNQMHLLGKSSQKSKFDCKTKKVKPEALLAFSEIRRQRKILKNGIKQKDFPEEVLEEIREAEIIRDADTDEVKNIRELKGKERKQALKGVKQDTQQAKSKYLSEHGSLRQRLSNIKKTREYITAGDIKRAEMLEICRKKFDEEFSGLSVTEVETKGLGQTEISSKIEKMFKKQDRKARRSGYTSPTLPDKKAEERSMLKNTEANVDRAVNKTSENVSHNNFGIVTVPLEMKAEVAPILTQLRESTSGTEDKQLTDAEENIDKLKEQVKEQKAERKKALKQGEKDIISLIATLSSPLKERLEYEPTLHVYLEYFRRIKNLDVVSHEYVLTPFAEQVKANPEIIIEIENQNKFEQKFERAILSKIREIVSKLSKKTDRMSVLEVNLLSTIRKLRKTFESVVPNMMKGIYDVEYDLYFVEKLLIIAKELNSTQLNEFIDALKSGDFKKDPKKYIPAPLRSKLNPTPFKSKPELKISGDAIKKAKEDGRII